MIIAHGPLGYLAGRVTQRWWKHSAQKPFHKRLYWVALLGGMFPDIDLVYFYFVDSALSHRQLPTHSILPYLAILIVGVLLVLLAQKPSWKRTAVLVFGIAGISHVLADSLVGLTVMFWPFTDALFGIPQMSWYQGSLLQSYRLPCILMLELIIIIGAGWDVWRPGKWFWYVSTGAVIAALATLLYIRAHVYSPNGLFYYADDDNDGILNAQDRDLDGDGILNYLDTDIDNDGDDNSLDIYVETFSAEGTLYDYTEGASVEIPLRLGMLTPEYTVLRMFSNVGLFFPAELHDAYTSNSTGYSGESGDNEFAENVENWKVWMERTGTLLPGDAHPNEYDVVFFTSGHVGIFTRIEGEDHILESHRSHLYTTQKPLQEVIQREGPIEFLGRVLPKDPQYQY